MYVMHVCERWIGNEANTSRITWRGPLAQLVEQLTLNQRVAGSSPARLTLNSIAYSRQIGGFCFIYTFIYTFPKLV